MARRLGYEKRADELLEIADDSSADWIETEGGGKVLNALHVNRARLMIDTRKWLLSKMLPKAYGDHLTVAGDPDQPIQHIVHRIDWATLSDEEIERLKSLLWRLRNATRSKKARDRSPEWTVKRCAAPPVLHPIHAARPELQ